MFFKKKHTNQNFGKVDSLLIVIFFMMAAISFYYLIKRPEQQAAQQEGGLATLIVAENEVKLRRSSDFIWKEIVKGVDLKGRDRIYTGKDSSAIIKLKGSDLELAEDSLLEISQDESFDFNLEYGFLKIKFTNKVIRIRSHGKTYTIEATAGKELSLKVVQDQVKFYGDPQNVQVSSDEGKVIVAAATVPQFNSAFCSKKIMSDDLSRNEICPDCSEQDQIALKLPGTKDFIVQEEKTFKLLPGENIFRLASSQALCFIHHIPELQIPDLQVVNRKVEIDHATGFAQVEFLFPSPKSLLIGKYVVQESSDYKFKSFKESSYQEQRPIKRVVRPGIYYFRGTYCLTDFCSEFSRPHKVEVVRPLPLPAPDLLPMYKIRGQAALPRTPDHLETITFSPVVGAMKYQVDILDQQSKMLFSTSTIIPELDFNHLPSGEYQMRVTPIDRWDRPGKSAVVQLIIEPLGPENPKHIQRMSNQIALFGGVNFFQLQQSGGEGNAKGGTWVPSYFNAEASRKFDHYALKLNYQSYKFKADSKDSQRETDIRDLSGNVIWQGFLAGVGILQSPYIDVSAGDFTLNSEQIKVLELGWVKESEEKNMAGRIKIRKSLTAGKKVKDVTSLVAEWTWQTPILKNGVYWYNGIEFTGSASRTNTGDGETQLILVREFVKTGIAIDF